MKIAIRADSSTKIGSGHIMRCLTLAECLRRSGAEVSFICRELPGNVACLIEQKGYPVYWLNLTDDADWEADADATAAAAKQGQSPDWLIVDHYELDARWEKMLCAAVRKIMVIDDLANREHDCALLLDANFYLHLTHRYKGLTPLGTSLLLGPQYALLRSEFLQVERSEQRTGDVKRIFVFFGGSDPTNETGKLLTALQHIPRRTFELDIVVGAGNPRKQEIERKCGLLENVHFFCQIDNMAELMTRADLAIGAGGTTLWERCYLALPSIVIAVADNQVETVQVLASIGAIRYLGFHSKVDAEGLAAAISTIVDDPDSLLLMSRKAKEIVPNNGTEAVVREMLSLAGKVSDKRLNYTIGYNVLITSAAKKAPMLQATRKAMAKLTEQGKLIAADSNPNCIARYFADEFWHMPSLINLTNEVLLSELHQRGIRYVIPTRDGELKFWSEKKELLQQAGVQVMVSDQEPVSNCLDKLCFYQVCLQLEIPAIPTSVCIEDLPEDRFVVKERYGAGARRIGLNLTRDQALIHAKQLEQPIFQPFIVGKEYSVDAYVDRQGMVKGVICRSRDYVVDGESQVTTTLHDASLERQCSEYIAKLGMYGHVMLQILIDFESRMWVVECNARFGGASTLAIAAGLDSFYWFLLEFQNVDLSGIPFTKSADQLRLVRAPNDWILQCDGENE